MSPAWPSIGTLALVVVSFLASLPQSSAQDSAKPVTEDGWLDERDETGFLVRTKELMLYPRSEPRPALKHRLLLDDFDRTPGNAATFYLKATGFFEQDSARERIAQFRKDNSARAEKEGKDLMQTPPYVWLKTPPGELPVNEVKEYMSLTSFQRHFIREGARRDHFDMDRNFRQVDDPISYLLPEMQVLRELARNQSIRCRLAIAEGHIDEAIEIIGQQFALSRHLGEDVFLISNLVGIATAGIAWNDALHLVQHPDAPNLYWALTAMPSPLVDIRYAMSFERQFLYQQLKVLREVDETPRPAGYWQDFIDRLLPQFGVLGSEFNPHLPSVDEDPQAARAALVGYVAAAYPGAKRYLIDEMKLPREQVETYPTAQVVFLAMVRFHDHWRDEVFKWQYLPVWQGHSNATGVNDALRAEVERYGWCTMPTELLLPAVTAVRTAEARCKQTIALLQTVEAIRMYAAAHDNKLPPSLDDLSVPAPIEPFTGKPIAYELLGDRAVLDGHSLPGMRYRLILRIAK